MRFFDKNLVIRLPCRGHFFIRKKPWFSKAFCVVLALKNERKKILTIRAT